MNVPAKIEAPTGLALLREPFPAHQISKLPKPTKAQTEAVKKDFKAGIRCEVCGGWHHPKVVHLDYVGHAALTDRLLDCDMAWGWEPQGRDERGLPLFDHSGGLWINLTVCGVTRPGYGSADGKQGGDAVKEIIGDALRNAAMRFGAALDLWHKGELHIEEPQEGQSQGNGQGEVSPPDAMPDEVQAKIISLCEAVGGNQVSKICEAYSVGAITDLTKKQATQVISRLEEKLAKRAKEKTDA